LQSLVDPGATIAEGYVGKVSPMPPMGVLLKPQELADVMAYILTLKEGG
jgi:mono/diheme cytochrome c family protein